MTNPSEITIKQEHINLLLTLHEASANRLDRAIERNSSREDAYRSECLAYERVLGILGIEYIEYE